MGPDALVSMMKHTATDNESDNECGILVQSLLALSDGPVIALRSLWLCKLMMPGTVVVDKTTAASYYVCSSHVCGAVVWKLKARELGQAKVWEMQRSVHECFLELRQVREDASEYEVYEINVCPELCQVRILGEHARDLPRLVLVADKRGHRLLEAAALQGFSSWTVPMLKDLVRHPTLGPPLPPSGMPSNLAGLLTLLIQHHLPGLAHDAIAAILEHRGVSKTKQVFESVLTPEEAEKCLDVFQDDLPEVLNEARRSKQKGRKKNQPAPQAPSPTVPSAEPSSSSGAGSRPNPATPPPLPAPATPEGAIVLHDPVAAAPRALVPRTRARPPEGYSLRPSTGDAFTKEEANRLRPQVRGCTLGDSRGGGWTIKYPGRVSEGKKSCTHHWGFYTGLTNTQALRECLQWAWALHTEATSEEPWFEFEELGA